ncbi:MAG: isochorismatase family protein, partial [Gemmatimonadota bacterium]|nr:isochorismatase family protein [Gemmatimonadota bacterium]
MQALLVVDVQNEFSPEGLRPIPNHASAVRVILQHIARARADHRPIAWIQHFNKPEESRAFIPGTWGVELSKG